jgi:sigma-B regulation protein RsbU (phosphoserine phosphatase)
MIRRKVLTVILSTSLGALLLLSLTGIVSILEMRDETLRHSGRLGDEAAVQAQEALATLVKRHLVSFVQDKAALMDEKLFSIQKQTGMKAEDIIASLNVNEIINSAEFGESGYAFLLNGEGQAVVTSKSSGPLISENGTVIGDDYLHSSDTGLWILAQRMVKKESGLLELQIADRAVYAAFYPLSALDWSVGVMVVLDEVLTPARRIERDILTLSKTAIAEIDHTIFIIILIVAAIIMLAALITVIVAIRLSNSIASPIISLTKGAMTISGGDLNYRFDVQTGDEIEVLAKSFNRMIGDIQTITAEKQRINSELSVASDIQNDMLPRIFPKFSSHKLVSIFAKMEPAKEVGGDFFDFFYLDKAETKIVFVIADVSGKGVPAALFMVIAKTLIKQQVLQSGDPANALEQVNKILCVDNPRCMFVTTLICTLDMLTGQMLYANAGHNPPLIARAGGPYQFMPLQKGIPPGLMEESRYKLSLTRLGSGDKLYLYTDGINEAMNKDGEQFGNERFLEEANKFRSLAPEEFDNAIRQQVALFADGAEQSDDITAVAIVYTGNAGGETGSGELRFDKEMTVAAKIEELDRVIEWVTEILPAGKCPPNIRNHIEVATEELFVNIASYAYGGDSGDVTIRINLNEACLVMRFEDSGVAFNPLEYKTADTEAGIEERSVGGLGIYLVRKWMDTVEYQRLGEKNILTLCKAII